MKARYLHTQTVLRRIPGLAPQPATVKHDYTHSAPTHYGDRVDNYLRQNGWSRRGLTVRQERQLRKTEKRSTFRLNRPVR